MIQCSDCEFFDRESDGSVVFRCDPFMTIKEPECLAKWSLLRIAEISAKVDKIVSANEAQANMYRRLAPLQEKMFRYMEREIESNDETERWKTGDSDFDDDDSDDPDER